MAAITKVKLEWSGFQGAPGVSCFYFRDFTSPGNFEAESIGASARVNAFADAIKSLIPSGLTLRVSQDVESIEETNGELLDIRTVPSATQYSNNAAVGQSYAAAAGAVINWSTRTVHRGRRIRGRSFIVPLKGLAFEGNGTLSNDTVTVLTSAATAMIDATGSPDLGIWARPQRVKDADGETTLIPNGLWAAAVSARVPDMSAVLRSRRD